jgi:hypothetical protein
MTSDEDADSTKEEPEGESAQLKEQSDKDE